MRFARVFLAFFLFLSPALALAENVSTAPVRERVTLVELLLASLL